MPVTVANSKWSLCNRIASIRLTMVQFGLCGMVLLVGCNKAAAPPIEVKPPEVTVQLPVEEEVLEVEETTGRLVARESVEVRSRVSGYLDKVLFSDGAIVQEGQPLFHIDARQYHAEMAHATANVQQAKARLERLERDEQRKKKLFSTKNTTQEDLDQTAADRAEASALLDAAIAMEEIAKLNLEFTKITSPISGRISRRLVDPGNLVKADDTPLVTVMSLHPIYAYFDIDERSVLKFERLIREGKVKSPRDAVYEVKFSLADEDQFTRTGKIDFLDNHLSPTTGTLRLRATVQNDDLLLSPGMFIRLEIPIGTPRPALTIPEEALGSDQGQRFLYVLNESDEVLYRRVRLGSLKAGRRVIEEGIAPEERVVVSGLQRVRVGKKVTPKLAVVAAAKRPAEPVKDEEPQSIESSSKTETKPGVDSE